MRSKIKRKCRPCPEVLSTEFEDALYAAGATDVTISTELNYDINSALQGFELVVIILPNMALDTPAITGSIPGYLANGAKVYITSRKAAVCDATAQRLAETWGGECISIPADMATLEGIEGFVSELSRVESHVDILIMSIIHI